ncbi:MAG TPA: CBS domain-containing protein [Eudoraea sp.]|nr:CBS domain-containing protein [Eudoraea sp.]
MGEQVVKRLTKSSDRSIYIRQLLRDIDALEKMLEQDLFQKKPVRIGVEQEFCLVNEQWEPSNSATEILKALDDPRFTSELTLYNLEINLDPLPLTGPCFSEMHGQLNSLLEKADVTAAKYKVRVLLTGILPTLRPPYLSMQYMTPMKRYKILNDAIKAIRKKDIELHIRGVDEINLHHDSIMYEGCNTSFQAHLQIDPDDFRDTYNWAQAIAGPILSICANSPMLMGRELWEETRIALFTQSVDTRASTFLLNEREPRVGFGNAWATGSAADFFKDSIIRFRSLMSADFESDSTSELEGGSIPKLKALALHNGTVYKWNRLCYGVTDGTPHLRLENRYLPSGPSTKDEIANLMFWVGVMRGRPREFDSLHKKMDFKDAKSNFFNAARYGMAAQFYWDNRLISSQELLLDHLLPMAYRGLYSTNVEPKDAEHYLSVIENRIRTQNGSRWIVNGYRKLRADHKVPDALKILTATMYQRQQKGYTVDAWQLPRGDEIKLPVPLRTVGDSMNTRTITAQESDSAELVLKMMQWNNIHHLPILNDHLNLSGLLTWTDVEHYMEDPDRMATGIRAIMRKELITATSDMLLEEAKKLMEANRIRCLPVVSDQKLVGILTSKDI